MEVFGKKDQDEISRLLAAKAAMEAAGLPVPDVIAEKLGEGYENKSPNELSTVSLPSGAVRFYQEDNRSGVRIALDKIPSEFRELVVLHQKKTDDSQPKPEPVSTTPSESSEDEPEPPELNEATDTKTFMVIDVPEDPKATPKKEKPEPQDETPHRSDREDH